jgi:hypothetical protein
MTLARCRAWLGAIGTLGLTGLAACAGNGSGLDANGQPIGSGGSSSSPLTADFQSIQDNIFTPICTRCHIGASAPEGLQLDAAHSYSLLVGVPSSEVGSILRVKPGDPDNSYVILKLQDSPGIVGAQMPFGGPYLPQSTIDVIRQWITDGAPQSSTASPAGTSSSDRAMSAQVTRELEEVGASSTVGAGAFAVSATSPLKDSVVPTPVTRVVISFNHEIDQSLVNDTTVSLERVASASDPMNTSAANVRVGAALSVPEGNSSTLLITPSAPLANGDYRVTLRGTGGAALADVNAQGLAADYTLSFTVDISQ